MAELLLKVRGDGIGTNRGRVLEHNVIVANTQLEYLVLPLAELEKLLQIGRVVAHDDRRKHDGQVGGRHLVHARVLGNLSERERENAYREYSRSCRPGNTTTRHVRAIASAPGDGTCVCWLAVGFG